MRPGQDTLAIFICGDAHIITQRRKVYLYADDTGQDTTGRLFIVGVVLVGAEEHDNLEGNFVKVEDRIRHLCRKWHRTAPNQKQALVAELPALVTESVHFTWSEWDSGTEYLLRAGEAVADAAGICCPGVQVTLTYDGLKPAERPVFAAALRRHQVRFRRIRLAARDEAYPLLRLADAVTGFLRDMREGAPYAVDLWRDLKGLFIKV